MSNPSPRIIGIGSADRTHVLGNLFVVGIGVPAHQYHLLSHLGVTNPKKLSGPKTDNLANRLIEAFDFWVDETKTTELNTRDVCDIQALSLVRCYLALSKTLEDKIFTYSFDKDRDCVINKMKKHPKAKFINFDNWDIKTERDQTNHSFWAAVAMARYYSRYHINDLRETYGNIGTGDFSDPQTYDFVLHNLNKMSGIIRFYNYHVISLLKHS